MPPSQKPNWRLATAVELVLLLTVAMLYIHLAASTVTSTGDHGELALACQEMYSGHPPGYPLFILLGKAVLNIVPLGGVVFRLNLLSALIAALAVWVTALSVTRLTKSRAAGIIAGTCLAFSPTYCSQAAITEVYSTQILFAAILVYLFTGEETLRHKTRLFSWFICSLAVFHHYTIAPLAALVIYRTRPKTPRDWLLMVFCFILGGSPFLLLPLTANRGLAWGATQQFSGLLWVMLRRQYWHLPTPPRALGLTVRQFFYITQVLFEDIGTFCLFLVAGTILLLLSGTFSTKKDDGHSFPKHLTKALLLVLIFGPPVALISNFPLTPEGKEAVRVLLLPLILSVAFLAGLACAKLVEIAGTKKYTALVLCAVIMFVNGKRLADQPTIRSDTLAYDYSRNLLKSAPSNSFIVASGGNEVFPLWFMNHRDKQNGNTIIDFRLLSQRWYRSYLRRHRGIQEVPLDFEPPARLRSSREEDRMILSTVLEKSKRLFFATPTAWTEIHDKKPTNARGLLFPLNPPSGEYTRDPITLDELQLRELKTPIEEHPLENRIFYRRYAFSLAIAAETLYRQERFREALGWAERAFGIDPDSSTAAAVLGSIYLQEGWFEKAESILLDLQKKSPDSPHVLYNLGLLFIFKNRNQDAVTTWRRLSHLYPGYRNVEEKLKKLE